MFHFNPSILPLLENFLFFLLLIRLLFQIDLFFLIGLFLLIGLLFLIGLFFLSTCIFSTRFDCLSVNLLRRFKT